MNGINLWRKLFSSKKGWSSNIFWEGNEENAADWIRVHYHCAVGLSMLVLLMELAGLVLLRRVDFIRVSDGEYLVKYVLAPSLLNLIFCVGAYAVRIRCANQWIQALVVSLLYVGIVFNAYTIHPHFNMLAMGFCVPVLISIIYGDRKITTLTFLFTLCVKTVSDTFIDWDPTAPRHPPGSVTDILNSIVAFLILCISYVIAIVITIIEQQKEEANLLAQQEKIFLHHKSITDELTGVWNRAGLRMAFDQIGNRNISMRTILCMIDMDRFKEINDTYGHATGDRYLMELGRILSSVARAYTFRYGGDEFLLLFTDCTLEEVMHCCQEVQERLREAHVCREIAPMTISMGIADCEKEVSPSQMLKLADQALYRAKENRGSIVVYEGEDCKTDAAG